jgi:hypothetical protein|tara:strand:+ start:199 stop:312 length:114 start_codon:yes stop_codon:yes gene_type:complete
MQVLDHRADAEHLSDNGLKSSFPAAVLPSPKAAPGML